MRRCASLALLIAFPLVVEGSALADAAEKGKGGASGPSAGPSAGESGSPAGDRSIGGDRPTSALGGMKPKWAPWFELGVSAEYDGLFVHDDPLGSVANYYVFSYVITAAFTPSPYDRIYARYGFSNVLLKDSNQSAVASDDF